MLKMFFIFFSVYICFILEARTESCSSTSPRFFIKAKQGRINYITYLSKDEFSKKTGIAMSPNGLGLTVVKMNVSGTGEPFVKKDKNRACVGLKTVTFNIGYDVIDVFIDKKYKPHTCEYKTIKEHENFHVSVSQQAISFFKPDLEKALKKAVEKLTPEYVYSSERAQAIIDGQLRQVLQEVQPVLTHINAKIAEKNAIIDTPESYRKTTALCKNW